MTDGHRHSLDIPLSRTLVALRRVRSLRDPSTNYVTKNSPYSDNVTWDVGSCYGISLNLANDGQDGCGLSNQSPLRCQSFGLEERREEFANDHCDPELDSNSRNPGFKSKTLTRIGKRGCDSTRSNRGEEPDYFRSNRDDAYRDKSFGHRCSTNHDRGINLKSVKSPVNHLEDFDSYSEPTLGSGRYGKVDSTITKQKSGYNKQIKSSRVVGEAGSNLSSPFPSLSDVRMDGSSRSTSIHANDEVDIVGRNHLGCGIGCCWSRTPRFRECDLPSDVDDHPLLSGEVGEMGLSGKELSCTYVKNESVPYGDSPRSLSQKFRPKSFSELVGQHVVARSLLNAISRGKITSFYLFHGSRGTGKTSTSRIFAAALNCLSLEEHGPCGLCRECMVFFSGRSRDVKEVDPVKSNQTDRVRSLLKDAARPPISSRYKVFIIDECQLLRGETWATILSGMDQLPRHAVFVLITADLDNLPRSAVSRCQRYHFPKINEVDIVDRLAKICVEEGITFDEVALDFIASKSSGSLRDAEMMLDQLSLLGKKITIASAHELIGIVSDEELLDLLDLAFSTDTSSTVKRARDLMRSRVDPMQLISQLANLIMDMLAGRLQIGNSEVGRRFLRNTSEVDLQKLRHALKILSETEKQLRTSKNQTTWLTVALLQLSSVEFLPLDANDSRACPGPTQKDDGFRCKSPSEESLKHPLSCFRRESKSQTSQIHPDGNGKLETIWRKALDKCQSNTLRRFLQKEGKLSSIYTNQGLAVAEVDFCRPDHVSRAEKSWKLIASSLQLVLGCNVEIRLNLVPCSSRTKNVKINKPSCSLLSCSRRMPSSTEEGNDHSDSSDFTSTRALKRGKSVETYSSDPGPHMSPIFPHHKESSTTIRNSEGNALSTGTAISPRSIQDDSTTASHMKVEEVACVECQVVQESESQPNCFSKTLRLQRKSRSSNASPAIYSGIQTQSNLELSIPPSTSSETYFSASDPYILCPSSNTHSNSSFDQAALEKEFGKNSKVHCWRAPKISRGKAWETSPQQQRSQLVDWLLPCATAK